MVMLIAGGSLSAGSHNPHFGTAMPPGAVHAISYSSSASGIILRNTASRTAR